MLPYGRQWLDESDIRSVAAALESDFLTTGPLIERFEQALAAWTGVAQAAVLNSGTAALHAAYHAAGLGPGDELITSPLTFAATANAALYQGATVRFVDIDPSTGNLDPKQLADVISPRTRVITTVDFAGHPADYDAINTVAQEHGLLVVADGAHSLGALYKGRPVGSLASLTTFSFHPVKPITTGEGGAVVSDVEEWIRRVRSFRSHGVVRNFKGEGPWYYEMQHLGYNYRLTDFQCALGLSQLKKLKGFIQRRRAIAARYNSALAEVPGLTLPQVQQGVEPGWHLYVVRVPEPAHRRPFFQRLRDMGIGVQVHYIPVYWHPYYQELGYRRGLCPRAEDFYARCVSLPIFPKMTDADVVRVIEAVSLAAKEVWG